ncbi:MAG: alkaline phosphatase family protein [Myxococcales bacterium]|nr:alkaline phosphatase family protein [Myxococcales bacterium]MDH3482767.1 alkaline phosphatase family protein [Myxococcales bacterium]
MPRIFIVLLAAASVGLSGCSARTPHARPTVEQVESPTVPPPAKAEVAPKLVVLIIVDQLATWVLDAYLPILPSDSVLRRAYDTGAYHSAAFPYATTQTAPGHASLTTGVTPAVHGIIANAIFDPEHGPLKTVDDRTHAVIGNPERFVSPTNLRAPTVADALYEHSGGKARIVGISMKGRSAVLPVGQKPNAAVFYDSKARAMTTSTFYAPNGRLPDWLRAFVEANPVEPLLQVWEPENPTWLEAHFGPDAGLGEIYPSFPHDPRAAPDPWYAFAFIPESTEYLIAAAFAAVKAEDMGMDDVPDLLVLGISGTDIVGHIWGPRSWEYADNLLRTDRALGRLVRILEARGPVAFVLTADHGIARMPERVLAHGGKAGRIKDTEVTMHAERAADAALGEGDWIAAYVAPLITYTQLGKQRRKELDKALVKAMPRLEGVKAVYGAHAGAKLRASSRAIERLVGESLPNDPPGDLYLVMKEGWFDALSEKGGTNHGSPWAYDRQIPVLMWGAGIERRTSKKVHSVLQVATSLSRLLDIPTPTLAPRTPLPGVMRLHD